jgi:hypothetical protein
MLPLVFKLVSAPLLLGLTTLVGRRWGSAIGGALAAMPVVSGSIAFFVTLENGPDFGCRTAVATLVGLCSLGWYSLVYARASLRFGWPACLVLAYAIVAVASLLVVPLADAPGVVVFAIATVELWLVYRWLPPVGAPAAQTPPPWDIPVRMIVGTLLVVILTGVAQSAGPQLSGLLAAFPMVFTVLLVFTHRHEGADRARGLLRGFVAGLVATSLFLEVVADGLRPLGLGATFALAIAAFVGYQVIVIGRMRRVNEAGLPPTALSADMAE